MSSPEPKGYLCRLTGIPITEVPELGENETYDLPTPFDRERWLRDLQQSSATRRAFLPYAMGEFDWPVWNEADWKMPARLQPRRAWWQRLRAWRPRS